jgi:hypothetical protein
MMSSEGGEILNRCITETKLLANPKQENQNASKVPENSTNPTHMPECV